MIVKLSPPIFFSPVSFQILFLFTSTLAFTILFKSIPLYPKLLYSHKFIIGSF